MESDDTVVEVGPGLGSLTAPLLERAGRVVAIEIDAGFVQVLRDRFGDGLELLHADALDVDLADLVEGGAWLVSNLPYNLATPLVVHALDAGVFDGLYVMVQREVGERWAAAPGDPLYSGISVKLQLVADVGVEASVPRTVFLPAPKVDSVMVRLTPRPSGPDEPTVARIRNVVDAAFAQRRKTLRGGGTGRMWPAVDDPPRGAHGRAVHSAHGCAPSPLIAAARPPMRPTGRWFLVCGSPGGRTTPRERGATPDGTRTGRQPRWG